MDFRIHVTFVAIGKTPQAIYRVGKNVKQDPYSNNFNDLLGYKKHQDINGQGIKRM